MSLLAQTMESLRFTEEQNRLILDGGYTCESLARRFKRPVRQVQRQRALLKRLRAAEEEGRVDGQG